MICYKDRPIHWAVSLFPAQFLAEKKLKKYIDSGNEFGYIAKSAVGTLVFEN
jgi:hypothetical protein